MTNLPTTAPAEVTAAAGQAVQPQALDPRQAALSHDGAAAMPGDVGNESVAGEDDLGAALDSGMHEDLPA